MKSNVVYSGLKSEFQAFLVKRGEYMEICIPEAWNCAVLAWKESIEQDELKQNIKQIFDKELMDIPLPELKIHTSQNLLPEVIQNVNTNITNLPEKSCLNIVIGTGNTFVFYLNKQGKPKWMPVDIFQGYIFETPGSGLWYPRKLIKNSKYKSNFIAKAVISYNEPDLSIRLTSNHVIPNIGASYSPLNEQTRGMAVEELVSFFIKSMQ
jgi:hypothetical protein